MRLWLKPKHEPLDWLRAHQLPRISMDGRTPLNSAPQPSPMNFGRSVTRLNISEMGARIVELEAELAAAKTGMDECILSILRARARQERRTINRRTMRQAAVTATAAQLAAEQE